MIGTYLMYLEGNAPINFKKQGIQGPLRCALCERVEETMRHLFLECPFSAQAWQLAVQGLRTPLSMPKDGNQVLVLWKNKAPTSF